MPTLTVFQLYRGVNKFCIIDTYKILIGYVLIYDHKHNHDQGHITTTILSRRTYTKPSHREYSNILIQRTKTTKQGQTIYQTVVV
jgi:hypothetical protein